MRLNYEGFSRDKAQIALAVNYNARSIEALQREVTELRGSLLGTVRQLKATLDVIDGQEQTIQALRKHALQRGGEK